MSDPYRPAYYPPPATAGSPYNPQDYADDNYGQITTHHRHSISNSNYHPQPQTQLTQTSRHSRDHDSDYLDPSRSHRSRHSRRNSSDDDTRQSRTTTSATTRSRSKSRVKELGASAAGGAAGAFIGHKVGHGNIGTLAGLAVGALGARALEQQYEKYEDRKRSDEPFSDDRRGGRGEVKRRKSFVAQAKDKVGGLLDVGGDRDGGRDSRRSRSHVGTSSSGGGGRSRRGRYSDDESEEEYERYARRGNKGDRHGGAGRRGRDDY